MSIRTHQLISTLLVFSLNVWQIVAKQRIIGGKAVSISDFPYQASLRQFSEHICGATILREDLAITAAHCFQSPGPYSIQVGVDVIDKVNGQVAHVEKALIHPQYRSELEDYDVCLLFLATNLTFNDKVQPAKLPEMGAKLKGDEIGWISGWGVWRNDGFLISKRLMASQIPTWKQTDCLKVYRGVLSDKMFCAGYKAGKVDACQGDSGGPFAINSTLWGIVSFGYGCAEPGYPGVYMNVAKFRGFVSEYAGL